MIFYFQYAILKSWSCIFGTCNIYFKLDPYFLEHEKAYENLKKDILGEESLDEIEGANYLGQESNDDKNEEEEQEEQLHIQYET